MCEPITISIIAGTAGYTAANTAAQDAKNNMPDIPKYTPPAPSPTMLNATDDEQAAKRRKLADSVRRGFISTLYSNKSKPLSDSLSTTSTKLIPTAVGNGSKVLLGQ